jgi:limonene-1,2-epoxide hydrolase
MNPNDELIRNFYSSFEEKDYRAMQAAYADHAVFNDPVFHNLDAEKTRAMWEMFCKRGKDLEIAFRNIHSEGNDVHVDWVAHYTFSQTGNMVINYIRSSFVVENGKIVKHTDQFDFHTWAKQALGTTGLLWGWTPFVKNMVRKNALGSLRDFMQKRKPAA